MLNRFLLILFLPFSNLSSRGLAEIADLPHAQKFITGVLKARNLDPNDFEFKFRNDYAPSISFRLGNEDINISMSCGIDYNYVTNQIEHSLYIQKKALEKVNAIIANQTNNLARGLSLNELEFKNIMQFILGHELQHHFDYVATLSFFNGSYPEFEEFWKKRSLFDKRQNEIKADKCASLDPKILRVQAKWFQERYNQYKDFYNYKYSSKNTDSVYHPHPLERAKYLLIAANAQEVINKKFNSALSCLIKKRREKKQQEDRIHQTLSDIEKVIG